MNHVRILGAGPAGCCAALSALKHGSDVAIADRSFRQRHKVCGEFFSPGIEPVLERLGIANDFHAARPAAVRRIVLCFGRTRSEARLPGTGWGLSRFTYDQLLLDAVQRAGGVLASPDSTTPSILAAGRSHENSPHKGERIFGWKAHFDGPCEDAVELYFFRGCYIGLNAVEGGRTNVCGLGPERVLREYGFDIDALIHHQPALRDRLAQLRRSWDWLHVGPLVFQNKLKNSGAALPCGDALSFVDPFTGSGLLAAALTGELAGRAAVEDCPLDDYLGHCRSMLLRPFRVASMLRQLAGTKLAESVGALAPGGLLFQWTRPHQKNWPSRAED